MLQPSYAAFSPESGKPAPPLSYLFFTDMTAEMIPDKSVEKGEIHQGRGTNVESEQGRRDGMWGLNRKIGIDKEWPYEAGLRQGLLSVNVAARSGAWHGCLW